MSEPERSAVDKGFRSPILVLSVLAGVLLAVIGLRFMLVPDDAARTFGLTRPPLGYELHVIVGLRDIWLAALALAFAALREWRALALWFTLASLVCFADAFVVAASTAKWWALAFHGGCGIICMGAAVGAWSLAKATAKPPA